MPRSSIRLSKGVGNGKIRLEEKGLKGKRKPCQGVLSPFLAAVKKSYKSARALKVKFLKDNPC